MKFSKQSQIKTSKLIENSVFFKKKTPPPSLPKGRISSWKLTSWLGKSIRCRSALRTRSQSPEQVGQSKSSSCRFAEEQKSHSMCIKLSVKKIFDTLISKFVKLQKTSALMHFLFLKKLFFGVPLKF